MIKVALLIISNANSELLTQCLIDTVSSARRASEKYSEYIDLSIYCSEKQKYNKETLEILCQQQVTKVVQVEPFNYNGELNRLIELSKQNNEPDYFILANSDLIFDEDCMFEMIKIMADNGLLSASPYDPHAHGIYRGILPNGELHFGYEIIEKIAGWCIFVHKSALIQINNLNQEVAFWYSDNIYADQLKAKGIQHALITSAICEHLGSKSLNSANEEGKDSLTFGEKEKYLNAANGLGVEPSFIYHSNISFIDKSVKEKFLIVCLMLNYPKLKKIQKKILKNTLYYFQESITSGENGIRLFFETRKSLTKQGFSLLWNTTVLYLPQKFNRVRRLLKLLSFVFR